jgi:hypothetical protein
MAGTKATRIALAVLGCSTIAAPSHAYLDPGTGSIILQSLLAGVAVAIGLLRLYWYRFKVFLSGLTGKSTESESKDEQEFGQDSEINNES